MHQFLGLLVLSTTVICQDVNDESNAQKFLREPENQVARQGAHVTLPCRVHNKKGMLQWTRNGFGLGVMRNLTGFDRYHMTGSDEEGDYTLDINPVMLEDDAKFQCQVGAAKGVAPIRSNFAVLTVTVPPQEPEIINGKELRTTEEKTVIILCISKGGKPAAEITWINSGGLEDAEISSTLEPVENTKRITAKSEIKFTAKKSHHNTTFTCEAQNSADPVPKKVSIRLFVEYAPDVSIDVDTDLIKENKDVTFICKANANPPEMTFRWFVNDVLVPGHQGNTLKIANIHRNKNENILKCEVSNAIGKSEETLTLDVHYAPEFVIKPTDVSNEQGHETTLVCLVDGNPKPSYTWFKNGDLQTVIGYSENYTVLIEPENVGRYICRASVKGYREISESAEVLMKGPPRILKRDPIQFGSEDENIHIVCEAFSIPPPKTIHWELYGFPVDVASRHFSLIQKPKKDGMISTLVIRNAISSDFGDYNCSVKNPYGQDSFIITLQRKKSLPLIIILSAVIGGITLTLSTILIMILCRRNSKNKKKDSKYHKTSSSNLSRPETSEESEALNPNKVDFLMNDPENQSLWDLNKSSSEHRFYPKPNMLPATFDEYQPRMDMAYIPTDASYGTLQKNLGYQIPSTPNINGSSLSGSGNFRGLNVIDPRFAAKYGNPYLRSSSPISPSVNASPNPSRFVNRPYATLNSPKHNSVVVHDSSHYKLSKDEMLAGINQYILSPEDEIKAGRSLATHV